MKCRRCDKDSNTEWKEKLSGTKWEFAPKFFPSLCPLCFDYENRRLLIAGEALQGAVV